MSPLLAISWALCAADAEAVRPAQALPPLAALPPPRERGLALGLFASDPLMSYRGLLEEIRAQGATHVLLAWTWWQDDVRAVRIGPRPRFSPSDAQVVEAVREARALGMRVTALPIVRPFKTERGEWRGTLQPLSEELWWAEYEAFILHAARLAEEGGAERFSVGSELVSREGMRARWVALIDKVRAERPGLELLYSANWDHYRQVSFWDRVDVVGLTAYFELTHSEHPSVAELVAAWKPVREQLEAFALSLERRVVITEVGYPSLDGGTRYPWDETRQAPIDLEEQRVAYEATARAWAATPFLGGIYFWNWFGAGGPTDGSYTPRHKPAAAVLRAWYRAGEE